MNTLRMDPPEAFGTVQLVECTDYQQGIRSAIPSGAKIDTFECPCGNLLIYASNPTDSVRIQIAARPSGTEPKIKFYFFCQSDLSDDNDLECARLAGDTRLNEVRKALTTWAEAQLGQPHSRLEE